MATTQRPRTPRRSAPTGSDPASRGLLLVLVAVALGAMLLWKGGAVGFDADGESVDIGAGKDGGDQSAEVTTTTQTTTTTIAPAAVKLVVANGAGVSGLAARTTEFLATQGYTDSVPTDATTDAPTTIMYYAEGYQGNAVALTTLLGMQPANLQALPPGAALASDQPAEAGLILVLGQDAPALLDQVAGTSQTTGSSTTAPSGTGSTTTTSKSATTTTAAD